MWRERGKEASGCAIPTFFFFRPLAGYILKHFSLSGRDISGVLFRKLGGFSGMVLEVRQESIARGVARESGGGKLGSCENKLTKFFICPPIPTI